jgi:hypothetical protein
MDIFARAASARSSIKNTRNTNSRNRRLSGSIASLLNSRCPLNKPILIAVIDLDQPQEGGSPIRN